MHSALQTALIQASFLGYNQRMKPTEYRLTVLWTLLLLSCFSFPTQNFSQDQANGNTLKLSRKERIERLNDSHRRWFNMIENISSKDEQSVFLQLDNDRDREIFIRTFWLQRDPTPGTTANEYKDDIEERFKHVLYTFKRGTSRPAWQTDMGRIYMVLGKPNSVNSMESTQTLYPLQIWYYYGDTSLGLPTYFSVLFFRPNNTPEWKLYNPATEDPRRLIIQSSTIAAEDYQTIYSTLAECSAEAASAAFSMIPNDQLSNFRPSWRSNFILNNIYESPQKKINVQYATNFLKYKGFVDMETSVNFIECSNMITVSRNERLGINFLNIALKPKKISVDFSNEQNKYYYNFEVSISIKKGETFIHEQKKNYDFYYSGEEVERLKALGMVISDTIPVIPGEYKVLVFARNAVGKEFTYFEKSVTVHPDSDMPFLTSPLVSYKLDDQELNLLTPFQIEKKRINIDPDKTFLVKEKPILVLGAYNLTEAQWSRGSLSVLVKGLNERSPYSDTVRIALNSQPYNKNIHYILPLSQDGLYTDFYQVTATLLSENQAILDTQTVDFTVAPHRNIPYPISTFKQARIENTAVLFNMLGSQCQNAGDHSRAAEYFERALSADPNFYAARIRWLQTLNQTGKYTQVIVESEPLKAIKENAFDYHLLRGTALYNLKDYDNALVELLAANKLYNSDIRVLNLLGLTFANQGNLEEAVKALEASLNLNSKQPQIQKIVAEMKEKLPNAPSVQSKKH